MGSAVALGLFDGVHAGHRIIIKSVAEMRYQGLTPTVFTFNNGSVTTGGKEISILTDQEKQYRIRTLGVDRIYSVDFEQCRDMPAEVFARDILVGRLGCKCAVCGYDFRFGKRADGDVKMLNEFGEKYGFDVIVAEKFSMYGYEVSSTMIKELIRMGEVKKANTMLCSPFGWCEKIQQGNQIGRFLGYPTINMSISKGLIVPKYGAYISEVLINGEAFCSVTNVGVKPTVGENNSEMTETHLINYSGDLYNKYVQVRLLDFIRPEQKFENFDMLKQQISKDISVAKSYFKK